MKYTAQQINEVLKNMNTDITVEDVVTNKVEGSYTGFCIHSKKFANAHPTIYESAFDDLETVEDYAHKIIDISRRAPSVNLDMKKILSRDNVMATVLPKLTRAKNKSNLDKKDFYYKPYLDLLVLLYIPIQMPDRDTGYITLTKDIINSIGVDPDLLMNYAINNLEEQVTCTHISQAISKMLGMDDDMNIVDDTAVPKMYVFTTERCTQGAAVILTKSFMDHVKMLFGDYATIIPSSIHEVLVVETVEGANMAEIIKDVNTTELAENEVLGDNPYFYVNGEIKCANA